MSIQIKNLLNWSNRTARAMNLTPFWMELVRTFGTELLYFLIDKEYADQIPESTAALKKFKTQITEWNGRKPKHGSAWILFAFKENLANLPAPFRKDGILLPFEWRTGEDVTQHSPLLPQGLIELAEKVKQQFGKKAEKYYLYPDSIFQDRVDFSMDGVGFSSSWGALVSGLYLALNPKAMLLEWPFSSIQFDFEKGEMDAVGHLEEKIILAASFNAAELAVAPCQYKEAIKALNVAKAKYPENKKIQKMKIFMVKSAGTIEKTAANIVKCNQHNKQRLIRNICLAHAAVLLLLAIIAGVLYMDHTRVYEEYYADYVDKWGMPTGIFPVDPETRRIHYRFISQGRYPFIIGKPVLRRVILSNSYGIPQENMHSEYRERPAQQVIHYKQGILDKIVYFDAEHQRTQTLSFSGNQMQYIDINIAGKNEENISSGISEVTNINNNIFSSLQEETVIPVGRFKIERDKNGFVKCRKFMLAGKNYPHHDKNGVWGEKFAVDEFGRTIERTYLNYIAGEYVIGEDNNGVSCRKYQYKKENMCVASYYNREGRLQKNAQGWKKCVSEFDSRGNLVKEEFLDENGNLVWNEYNHAAVIAVKYNSAGLINRILSFDVTGKLKKSSIIEYSSGRIIKQAWYDTDGKACSNDDNTYHQVRVEYDKYGRTSQCSFYDIQEKLIISETIPAIYQFEYNSLNEVTKKILQFNFPQKAKYHYDKVVYEYKNQKQAAVSYFKKELPAINGNGFFQKKTNYNTAMELEDQYFGKNNELCNTTAGYAIVKKRFNNLGLLIREEKLDKSKTPANTADGIYLIEIEYNSNGEKVRRVETSSLGIPHSPQVFSIVGEYYKGREISVSSFGKDGLPVDDKHGIHFERNIYSQDGSKYTLRYNSSGTPVKDQNGVWVVKRTYGKNKYDKNKIVYEAYFELDTKTPMLNNNHVHCGWAEYDTDGNMTVLKAGDKKANLIPFEGNVAEKRWRFVAGKEVEYGAFDRLGRPVNTPEGIHKIQTTYEAKKKIKSTVYDSGNKIIKVFQYTPEETISQILKYFSGGIEKQEYFNGKVIRQSYWSNDMKPIEHNGIHYGTVKYDEAGNKIEVRAFTLKKKPAVFNGKTVAVQCWKYDNLNREVLEYYLGVDEKPVNNDAGIHLVKTEYFGTSNKKSRQICYAALLKNEENSDHIVRILKYDDLGRISYMMFSDKDRIHKIESHNGKVQKHSYWDVNANDIPWADSDGIHCRIFEYHTNGQKKKTVFQGKKSECLKIEWYDIQGKLIERHLFRSAFVTKFFFVNGKTTEVSFWKHDGVTPYENSGFHKYINKYNAAGHRIQMEFRDRNNNWVPILGKKAAVAKYKTDKQGRQIQVSFYGVDEKPCQIINNIHTQTTEYKADGGRVEKHYSAPIDLKSPQKNLLSITIYDKNGKKIK